MKKQWISSLMLAFCLTTAALAQQPTQQTGSANATPSTQRNTSSREGLDRKGGKDVGTRGSAKMKDGVSRSGNSNLSPTSPTNVPPPGGDKPGSGSLGKAGVGNKTATEVSPGTTPAARPKPRGTGTSNGNSESTRSTPMQTQGSTSEGSASKASPGGAAGTNTRVVRSVRPKSRSALLEQEAAKNKPSAAGLAGSARKAGDNGERSPGATPGSLTERGKKEGSYSDAAKRNKTAGGPSKDPLKTGPNGQQTKPKNQ